MITSTSKFAPGARSGLQSFKGAWQRLSVALLFMVLSATAAWAQGYEYIAADGTTHNTADDGIELDTLNGSSAACNLGVEDQTKWYVVKHSIGYENVINCHGNVNIILVDTVTMSVYKNGRFNGNTSTLNIYGQAKGTGKLSIKTADGHDGIYCGQVVINGGTVECIAQSDGQGSISGGSIIINGGTVTAIGSDTEDGMGLSSMGNITINGGKVTATGGLGIYSSLGTITLGSSHADDFIYASSYWSGIGSIVIKDGQTLAANDVEIYRGNLSSKQRDAIAGKTLKLVEWSGTGAETDPYLISIPAELNLLALRVNEGDSDYSGKYFRLNDNISFFHKTDGTEGADTENNFTAIGNDSHLFKGHFDGKAQDYTISGIRIYKGGSDNADKYQGLFGAISGSDIHDVTLIDARITAHSNTGGIVGFSFNSTVSDCHVASDVTIHAVKSDAIYHGGIVGFNGGSNNADTSFVSNCTSAATLTLANAGSGNYYGGIVGYNVGGTLSHNFAIGAVIPATEDNYYGAISGNNGGTLQNNYYHACTVAGVENATNAGCNSADITDGNGAVPAYLVTLGDGVTLQSDLTDAQGFTYYGESGSEPGYYCHAGAELALNALPTDDPGPGYQYAYTVDGIGIDGTTLNVVDHDFSVALAILPIDWAKQSSGDSWDNAYMIYNKDQLNLLAQRVNDGTSDYKDRYFQLGQNIVYPHKAATDEGADTEHNYNAIGLNDGTNDRFFKGHFDGASYTVSGIRIYKSGNDYADRRQGLFGQTSGAEIKGITLADTRITGNTWTGGIVGLNCNGATVSDCHVAATVTIRTVEDHAFSCGGIVGENRGTVSNCTSVATLTLGMGVSDCEYYGGIVGRNLVTATMSHNLAIGAVVPAVYKSHHGAICGYNEGGILESNYYQACTVAGVENATNVGCAFTVDDNDTTADVTTMTDPNNAEVTYANGATSTLRDNADNSDALALLATIATAGPGNTPLDLGWGAGKYPMQLSGRTLWRDGDWNTLCLPFDVTIAGSVLEGADIRALDTSATGYSHATGLVDKTLYLNFTAQGMVTEIKAGTPYIIKWGTADSHPDTNLTNPVFQGVTVDNSLNDVTFPGGAFKGNYNYKEWAVGTAYPSILLIGAESKLFWPDGNNVSKLGACRAYFELSPGQQARQFVLNFDGGSEATMISPAEIADCNATLSKREMAEKAGAWYSIDGRKLDGKPTKKGLYIHNGRKVTMK